MLGNGDEEVGGHTGPSSGSLYEPRHGALEEGSHHMNWGHTLCAERSTHSRYAAYAHRSPVLMLSARNNTPCRQKAPQTPVK